MARRRLSNIHDIEWRESDLWDRYGSNVYAWPEEAKQEFAELQAAKRKLIKAAQRRARRKAKRLASGGTWHE
jgi:hypothetical protein